MHKTVSVENNRKIPVAIDDTGFFKLILTIKTRFKCLLHFVKAESLSTVPQADACLYIRQELSPLLRFFILSPTVVMLIKNVL